MRDVAGYVISKMAQTQRDNLSPKKSTLIAVDGQWADPVQVKLAAVWLQFLLISPSYELARRDRTGTLTAADQARLPADFATVLSVYDDLGDVQCVSFEDWWMTKGIRYFGYPGEQPSVLPVHVLLNESDDPLTSGVARLNDHIDGKWERQGRPTSFVLSIPTCLSNTEILEQISNLIDGVPEGYRNVAKPVAKYLIRGTKHDIEAYFLYLKCLFVKAECPKLKLWQIGMFTNLSTTYSPRLARGEGTVEDQQALKPIASRALHKALMLAENAARGIFPSYQTCKHAVAPIWEELGALIAARQAWEEKHEA